jgi:putative addiction module killer protein
MYQVLEYLNASGVSPFAKWFDGLTPQPAARIAAAIARIATGNLGDHTAVGEGVIECRLDFGPGYRLYLGRDGGDLVILLQGGTKRAQQNDIIAAQKMWRDYKGRTRGK